jgi:uncharacterized membrane protein
MRKGFASLVILSAAALGWIGFSPAAEASYKICNKAKKDVVAAFGYQNEKKDWMSEGWWRIKPGDCATVYGKDLDYQKYYFYAHTDNDETTWEGNMTFCTISKEFTITGREDCKSRGYKPRNFREVDVGDSTDWTSDLTDD